ncbi:SusC/RagA family TonB-linked outer membrane protein [Portibacter lacus]|uniref:SusC/RagA family TonB-linked outer membrane protein n=2 Tax=Portibacter lacus TaxID=1099794 RepID=A0AA37SSH6_9BACT|nr:SusC/RagA family TonB-linked outer membrane protein [Portibacter lacus]
MAQRTVSGTLTDESGEALIGANVIVKGTTTGTITDFDGNFSLEVPEAINTLVFSYAGFTTQEVDITGQSTVAVILTEGLALDEVVVTALGIKREEKSLGYSVQEIGGADLVQTQSTNIVSNLAGNVAGVQVISGAGSSLGGSAKIRIRGVNGLTGGDPLFVVDGTPISNSNFSGSTSGSDFGNLASDINPDDIDKISVLKGPSASALYGNRAKNGVVLITLKKGAKSKGIGVTASSSVSMDKVYILPSYQDEYAGGYNQDLIDYVDPVDGQTYKGLNYSADESWGPALDGTQYRPYWSWFPGADYGTTIPLAANPDNVRDFFDTGVTNQNSVSISGGGEETTFRLSYSNVNQTGVFPNSKFNKNSVGLSAGHNLTDKLKVSTSLNIVSNSGRARPEFGYNGKNPANSFNQWFQRQLDIDKMREYLTPEGIMQSWNIKSPSETGPLYWDNPFYIQNESFNTDSRSRYYGDLTLSYAITDDLNIRGSVHRDDYSQSIEYRNGSQSLDLDSYQETVYRAREDNFELIMDYAKNFGTLSFDATAGGNIRFNNYNSLNGATVGGLNTPNLFNLNASIDRPTLSSYTSNKQINSLFAAANIGYNDFLYVGATIRNDWSSALAADDNSYLYPSVSGSLVFSELLDLPTSIFSFGKLRASYAQVGSDLGVYQNNNVFSTGTPYGSTASFGLGNTLIDPNIRPALSTSYEAGVDLRFLNDKLGLDFTYYNQDSKDEILTVSIPGSTGYTSTLVNAGLFRSNGYEVTLYATPFDKKNFGWNFSFNFANNTSQVVELYEDLTNYKIADAIGGTGWGGLSVNAKVGEEYGALIGGGYTLHENGQKIISESGAFKRTGGKDLGSILPDYTGGLRTGFRVYGFDINAMFDFQIGGKFFSVSKMFNNYSGLGIATVGNNDLGNPIRNPVTEGADSGGILVEGVLEDGSPYSTHVAPSTYYGRFFGFHEEYIYDATYLKWRELSIGYSLPKNVLGGKFTKLRLSAIVKNPLLLYSKVDGIDPSEILPGSNNVVFEERGGLPGTRSFGIKLDIGL